MKEKWNKISRTLSGPKQNVDLTKLDDINPDDSFCQKFLCAPSSHNYATINSCLARCSPEWLKKFLESNALQLMIATLGYMSLKSNSGLVDAVIQLDIIKAIKKILNSPVGMDHLIDEDPISVKEFIFGNVYFYIF